jgi:hypothetical protein
MSREATTMNRRTTALVAIGIIAWASILVSQITAVAAPANPGHESHDGQSDRHAGRLTVIKK